MGDVDSMRLNYQQLLTEITTLLATTADPSDANALKLNQELQRRLEQVRTCMLELLKLVRARYARNEEILIRRLKPRSHSNLVRGGSTTENIGQSGAILRGGTFRFKGNLYFRDVDGRSCPNNEDYNSRCATEMFPTDFDMRSKHVWTVLDKKNVVMGVKQQLLNYLSDQNKLKTPLENSSKRKYIDLHEQTLASLLETVDSGFSIDWNQLSTLDVEYRHSSYSCEAMWLVYLHPQLKRDDWTTEEDATLIATASAKNLQNWTAIAAAVPRRSDYQCYVRMHTALRLYMEPTSGLKWGPQDNDRLRAIVSKNTMNGVVNWCQVVEHFPGRSKSTLIGRYMYVLHPSISHEPFTPVEDLMLFAAFDDYNGKFSCIPRALFPNRSLTQLRTRYNNVLAQRNKTDSWSVEDDSKLLEFVKEHGTSQWLNCANHLGNHTRTSCRTRFMVINRFLEQHPNATVANIPRRRTNKNAQITADNYEERLLEYQEDPGSLLNRDVKQKYPKVKKLKREPETYVDTLRGVDIHIYEYFKYAYNLNLKSPLVPIALPRDGHNLNVVANALNFRPPGTAVKIIQSVNLLKQLSRCYNKMLRQLPPLNASDSAASTAHLLPPNWSTMMGFRAICILSVHCQNSATAVEEKFNYDESHTAVQLFRQRLRSLFYRTTLLSRLEKSVFEQLPNALTALPRPAAKYALSETEICIDPPPPRNMRAQQPQMQRCANGLAAQQVARNQIEELELLRPELKACKDEPTVKQEMAFE